MYKLGNIVVPGLAQEFLQCLSGDSEAKFTFQTFDDSNEKRPQLAKVFHGTFNDICDRLFEMNSRGAGIFVVPNVTDLKGRRRENILGIRSYFVDSDNGPLPELVLPPSIIVSTKRGEHGYWLVEDGTVDQFSLIQKALIHHLNTDRTVHDLPRVMRLPGFCHMKNPNQKSLVSLKKCDRTIYTTEHILTAFPTPATSAKIFVGTKFDLDEYRSWVRRFPIDESYNNVYGGRNATVLRFVREGLAQGFTFDDLKPIVHEYCERSGLDHEEAQGILARQTKQHSENPFIAYSGSSSASPADLAERFLDEVGLRVDGDLLLRTYRDDHYIWDNRKYDINPVSDIKAQIVSWLQSHPHIRKRAGSRLTNEILLNVDALVHVSASHNLPVWLNGSADESRNFIPMRNGILEIERLIRGSANPIRRHTPRFFTTSCLPYDFDPNAKCDRWLQFLEQVLPDPEVRDLLCEWFGYNLTFDTTQEKFVFLEGEGANGKSVICLVLKLLLGDANVSAVGLEAFSPIRTFPLAATIGKLANIVEEVGEIDKAAEGVIKNFVSGGSLTVERKHRDPFVLLPTARLTLATNSLPRFADRTDGLWRRMIYIPFRVRFLDESKQDKSLKDPDWWQCAGELPGIFNWAIKGLIRLRTQGRFTEPAALAKAKATYRKESSPARSFLEDNCEQDRGARVSSKHLYTAYAGAVRSSGLFALSEPQFAKEVRRQFPEASLSENPQRIEGVRSRVWHGIKLLGN